MPRSRPRFGAVSTRWVCLTGRTTREIALVAYLGLQLIAGAGAAFADGTAPGGLMAFDIPAQPLADALNAYGAATGLEVFLKASLAAGYRSTAVKGRLSPEDALTLLLSGTGYISKVTGPNIISIVSVPAGPALPSVLPATNPRQYDLYFPLLQARLSQALCSSDAATPEGNQIVLMFWMTGLGTITHVEIITGSGDPARDRAIVAGMEGLSVGQPPPADMPQPLTMAIYPPQAGEASGCPRQ